MKQRKAGSSRERAITAQAHRTSRASTGGRRPRAAGYTCPMHPGSGAEQSGPCPKCGMALGRWPSHIWQDRMGLCPDAPGDRPRRPGTPHLWDGARASGNGAAPPTQRDEIQSWQATCRAGFWLPRSRLTAPLVPIAMGHLLPGHPISRSVLRRGPGRSSSQSSRLRVCPLGRKLRPFYVRAVQPVREPKLPQAGTTLIAGSRCKPPPTPASVVAAPCRGSSRVLSPGWRGLPSTLEAAGVIVMSPIPLGHGSRAAQVRIGDRHGYPQPFGLRRRPHAVSDDGTEEDVPTPSASMWAIGCACPGERRFRSILRRAEGNERHRD